MRKFIRRSLSAAALAGASFVACSAAQADPLDPTHLPADTKWVLHVDMDSLRKTETWKTIDDLLEDNPMISDKIGQVEALFNARFPDDLHDVTLSGAAFGNNTGAVMIHATIDRKQLENALPSNPGYASEPHGDHALLTWNDHGATNYGTFYSDSQLIIGPDKNRVIALMDALDAKVPTLKPTDDLTANQTSGVMVYVAGEELAKLREIQVGKSPLLTQMKSASIALSEDKEDTVVRLAVDALDAPHASKMRQAADGLLAVVSLAADEPDAKPFMPMLAGLAEGAKVSLKGDTTVIVELHVPTKNIPDLIKQAIAGGPRARRK